MNQPTLQHPDKKTGAGTFSRNAVFEKNMNSLRLLAGFAGYLGKDASRSGSDTPGKRN